MASPVQREFIQIHQSTFQQFILKIIGSRIHRYLTPQKPQTQKSRISTLLDIPPQYLMEVFGNFNIMDLSTDTVTIASTDVEVQQILGCWTTKTFKRGSIGIIKPPLQLKLCSSGKLRLIFRCEVRNAAGAVQWKKWFVSSNLCLLYSQCFLLQACFWRSWDHVCALSTRPCILSFLVQRV